MRRRLPGIGAQLSASRPMGTLADAGPGHRYVTWSSVPVNARAVPCDLHITLCDTGPWHGHVHAVKGTALHR